MESESEIEEHETISYVMLCEELENIINGETLPIQCTMAIQEKSSKSVEQGLKLHTYVVEVLSKVSPSEMKDT